LAGCGPCFGAEHPSTHRSTSTKGRYLSGVRNVVQASLCGPLAAYCYEYNTGTTCMWGDDGSMQLKYGAGFVGMGFGNAGAAWANSTVLGWINNKISAHKKQP